MPVGKPCPYCYCVSPKLAARNKFGFLGLLGASFQCIICITYQELPRVTAFQNTVSQMHKACLTAYSVHHSLGQILQHTSPLTAAPLWAAEFSLYHPSGLTAVFLFPFSTQILASMECGNAVLARIDFCCLPEQGIAHIPAHFLPLPHPHSEEAVIFGYL